MASEYRELATIYERAAIELAAKELRSFLLGQASSLKQIMGPPVDLENYVQTTRELLENLLSMAPRRKLRVLRRDYRE